MPCPSTWYFLESSVTSSGPISVVVSEPWVSLIASEWFNSLPGSFSSEIQGPSCIFGESSPFRAVYFYISYGSYSGWVPRSASGEIQHTRARGRSSSTDSSAITCPRGRTDEPLGFRRYQTRMGPRAPSPVPRRRARRARPSKRARTSGPGESSSSRPPSSPVASPTEMTSSPQLSPASRIRRPMFVGHRIPGNA